MRYRDEILPDGSEFANTCRHFVATPTIPCHLKIPQVDSDYHINIRVSNFVHFGSVWVPHSSGGVSSS